MKRVKMFISLLMVLVMGMSVYSGLSIASADASYESIFEKDKVIDIKIEIADEDLQSIYDNPSLEEYHSANITVDGTTVENIGIRTKGNSSLGSVAKSDSERYSYRIKFNKYIKGQKLLGLDEMVINNMFSDASYMREYLSYEAMREAGMDVPLAVFANIYINGQLKGFYLCVEAIEDAFLDRSFGNNDGNLYKQEQGSTLIYTENNEYLTSELKVGADTEKTGLKNMIKALNEKSDIESVLDVESSLKYIAANTVLGSYDSYNGQFSHNYYIYEQNGKFTIIPWDYNMSFGGFGQGGSGWSVSLDSPVSGVSMESRPLINNLLSVPEYKEQYLEYVKVFAGYLENIQTRVDQLANIIRPYVEVDPSKFVTMEQFENNIKYIEETERTDNGGGNRQGGGVGFGGQDMGQRSTEGGNRMIPPSNQDAAAEQGSTRGNMGVRGNMGGGQRPEGMTPPGGIMHPEGMTPPDQGSGGVRVRQGGMGSGSIITYSVKRLANINSQLNGETASLAEVAVMLKGQKLSFDVAPVIENDRTLVPLRAIFEAMGLIVEYDNGNITASKDGLEIKLTIDSITAFVNGDEKVLDVPGKIVNNRTLVPLRFIGEATGLTVTYDDSTKTINME